MVITYHISLAVFKRVLFHNVVHFVQLQMHKSKIYRLVLHTSFRSEHILLENLQMVNKLMFVLCLAELCIGEIRELFCSSGG